MYVWVTVTGTPQQLLGHTYHGLLALFPNGQLDVSTINCVAGRVLRTLPLPF